MFFPGLLAFLRWLFVVSASVDDRHHVGYRKNVHTGFPHSLYRQVMCITLGLRV